MLWSGLPYHRMQMLFASTRQSRKMGLDDVNRLVIELPTVAFACRGGRALHQPDLFRRRLQSVREVSAVITSEPTKQIDRSFQDD
jgi:hypothetical protein